MIPYGRQTIEEDDIQAVVDVLKSDYLTTGPKIAEFEKAVADYVGQSMRSLFPMILQHFMRHVMQQKSERAMKSLLLRSHLQHLQTVCSTAVEHLFLQILILKHTILIRRISNARLRHGQRPLYRCIWQVSHAIWMPFMKLRKNII